jgi:hypothetical protein
MIWSAQWLVLLVVEVVAEKEKDREKEISTVDGKPPQGTMWTTDGSAAERRRRIGTFDPWWLGRGEHFWRAGEGRSMEHTLLNGLGGRERAHKVKQKGARQDISRRRVCDIIHNTIQSVPLAKKQRCRTASNRSICTRNWAIGTVARRSKNQSRGGAVLWG